MIPLAALITVWWTAGFNLLLFLAGLRAIPREIYEAAALDGAGRWAQFRRITLPLLWPVTALVLDPPAAPADQGLRPGLPAGAGRPRRRLHGAGAVHLHRSPSSGTPGGYAAAVAVAFLVHRADPLGPPVPGPARAGGRGDERPVERAPARPRGPAHQPRHAGRWRSLWAFPLVCRARTPRLAAAADGRLARTGLGAYWTALTATQIGRWYLNSLVTAAGVTVDRPRDQRACGYAISQLDFPGRRLLWWVILASFLVPAQALIVNHFLLMNRLGPHQHLGRGDPAAADRAGRGDRLQAVLRRGPARLREAAAMDGARAWQILFRIYLPLNRGVTTALAIIIFIGAWNAFLWPFLVVTRPEMMTITVGITAGAGRLRGRAALAAALLAGAAGRDRSTCCSSAA